MNTPEAVSLVVVENNNQKEFFLPDGSFESNIIACRFSSHREYVPPSKCGHTKEVDTPFHVFRDGQPFDKGTLSRIFGSDGYYVVDGMGSIDRKGLAPQWLHASWFEPGDVITLVRIPSNHELQKRRQ